MDRYDVNFIAVALLALKIFNQQLENHIQQNEKHYF